MKRHGPNIITGAAYLSKIRLPREGRDNYKDSRVRGLELRVGYSGLMVWNFRARLDGRQQRFDLGKYPKLGLADARKLCEEWRIQVKAGIDPRIDIEAEKLRDLVTFGKVRDQFMAEHVAVNLKHSTATGYRAVFNVERLKPWEDKPLTSITRADVRSVLRGIVADGNGVHANRVRACLKKFFNWCAEEGIVKEGEPLPTDRVPPPFRNEKPRDRVLTRDEVKQFWSASGKLGYPMGPLYKFILATGQRCQSECARIKWSDIGEGVWTQSDNKADRPALVPLNRHALAALEDCPRIGPYAFSYDGEGPCNSLPRAKRELDAIMDIEPWTNHDLRRTMATMLSKARVNPADVSALLNHAKSGVTGRHYDMYDRLDEKITAMATWSNILDEIIDGKSDNVVRLETA